MKKILFKALLVSVCFLTSINAQETCLKNAWDAYNNRNWRLAIQNAEDCIFSFGAKATEIERQLIEEGYVLPRNYNVGNALSAQQKDEIFSHGLLNDVCTSYWIMGMCYLRLNDREESRDAFRNTIRLTMGLCYDPDKDLFWSPSDDAQLRIN
jgi:hypothetical protein